MRFIVVELTWNGRELCMKIISITKIDSILKYIGNKHGIPRIAYTHDVYSCIRYQSILFIGKSPFKLVIE